MTGGGVSLCIDTTLYLIAKMVGKDVAEKTAHILEYERARNANKDMGCFSLKSVAAPLPAWRCAILLFRRLIRNLFGRPFAAHATSRFLALDLRE